MTLCQDLVAVSASMALSSPEAGQGTQICVLSWQPCNQHAACSGLRCCRPCCSYSCVNYGFKLFVVSLALLVATIPMLTLVDTEYGRLQAMWL